MNKLLSFQTLFEFFQVALPNIECREDPLISLTDSGLMGFFDLSVEVLACEFEVTSLYRCQRFKCWVISFLDFRLNTIINLRVRCLREEKIFQPGDIFVPRFVYTFFLLTHYFKT